MPRGEQCSNISFMHVGMTVRGRVRDGRLRVDAAVDLPDNTEVELALIVDQDDEPNSELRSRLDAHLRAAKAELGSRRSDSLRRSPCGDLNGCRVIESTSPNLLGRRFRKPHAGSRRTRQTTLHFSARNSRQHVITLRGFPTQARPTIPPSIVMFDESSCFKHNFTFIM
jgi:hypothetical protein